MTDLADRAAAMLGRSARVVQVLHGGDLSDALAVTLDDQRVVVVKSGRNAAVEAEMLRALRRAACPAPDVLHVREDILILQYLPNDGSVSSAWRSLGRTLHHLHDETGAAYGWDRDFRFGSVAIPNASAKTWPEFWGERRLLSSAPHVGTEFAKRLEKLTAGLPERVPLLPDASLLHGDLWSGNILISRGEVTGLVDPACYYGHSEVDLAMLTLFGSPSGAFWEAYGELEAGFEARVPIYQLWPALVHLRLFGSGYAGMVDRLLKATGV
ncbi:MAG: fructosamine kinase family protein [Pseudomonadota bacterium]